MRRDFHDAVFLKQGVICKHAVDAAAERTFVYIGRRGAAAPALKEIPSDTVADPHSRHAWANFDDFAGPIRERNNILTRWHAIAAPRDGEIAEIERAGFHLHQHLAMCGFGIGALDLDERLDPGAAFGQLIDAHDFSSF